MLNIIGRITTTTQATNNNSKLVFTPTGGAAVDICATNAMNARTAGKVISITNVKNQAMLVSPDDGVVVVTSSTRLILTPGIISLDCVGNTTGVIAWEIHYRPITPSSLVT